VGKTSVVACFTIAAVHLAPANPRARAQAGQVFKTCVKAALRLEDVALVYLEERSLPALSYTHIYNL